MIGHCGGCGKPIPGNRMWCSNRCRRNTLYGGTCIDCGAPTSGANGPLEAAPRCKPCALEARRVWTRELLVAALQRWADDHGGVPPTSTDAVGADPSVLPSLRVFQRMFGSWRAGILAAGFDAYKPGYCGRPGEYEEIRLEAASLYQSGMTAAEVGEVMGVSGHTVLNYLKAQGVPRRGTGRRKMTT